jgi:hypothetical protein
MSVSFHIIKHTSKTLERVPDSLRTEFYNSMKELGGPTVGELCAEVIGAEAASRLPPNIRQHVPGTKPPDDPLGLDLLPSAFFEELTKISGDGYRVTNIDHTRILEITRDSVEGRARIVADTLAF